MDMHGKNGYVKILDDNRVMKYNTSCATTREQWQHEVDMQTQLSGFAPRVFSYSTHFIIMERCDYTAMDYLYDELRTQEEISDLGHAILALATSLSELGYMHGDMHLGNIMFLSGKWVVIDCGMTCPVSDLRGDMLQLVRSCQCDQVPEPLKTNLRFLYQFMTKEYQLKFGSLPHDLDSFYCRYMSKHTLTHLGYELE